MHVPDSSDASAMREVFTSRFNRVIACVVWVLDAFVLGTSLIANTSQPSVLVPGALVAFLAWVVLWRPNVEVDDEAVTLRNVLGTVRIPWAAIIQVDTKYSLSIRTPRRVYSAWAAPAPGRTGLAFAKRAERHGRTPSLPGGANRPGDLLGTESGQAAYIVRERWDELRESGRIDIGVADSTVTATRWHVWELLVVAALVTGSVLLLGGR
jgi:hypothetical protein